MVINHLAIWVRDLEKMKQFYGKYFSTESNGIYKNDQTGFSSYFLTFPDGPRLEIMSKPGIKSLSDKSVENYEGYCHLAVSLGSKEEAIRLTGILEHDGYRVLNDPRTTGDGYFESVILDPENNRIELTL